MKKNTNFPKDSCSASTSSSMMKKTSWVPKGSSTSCSASTSSSMVKKTGSPKASSSSSSSVSRNPPATSNPRIAEDEFQSYSAFKKNNRPTTTHDQSVASLASINEGDPLIQFQDWSVGRVLKIHNNDPSLLDDIEPNDIVMVAELKLGSLYLQKILKDDPLYFNKIFYATLEDMFRLMTNSEGTYVIRKLHSLCDASHMEQIVQKILSRRDDLKYAAKNEAGADTLMKLISVLKSTTPLSHKYVLDSLTSVLCVDIMRSKPGSNLFESCLKDLDYWQNQILYNTAATHCIDLATDASGYAFLIALIKNNTLNPYKKALLLKIADNAAYLSQDPKGSYVIQATLLRDLEVDYKICKNLAGTYLYLSMHKYANHVVQKCILSSGKEHPILELIDSRKLHLLSKDQVGNYVVQKALTATKSKRPDLYYRLVGQIHPYLEDLQHHPIGRYVVFKLI